MTDFVERAESKYLPQMVMAGVHAVWEIMERAKAFTGARASAPADTREVAVFKAPDLNPCANFGSAAADGSITVDCEYVEMKQYGVATYIDAPLCLPTPDGWRVRWPSERLSNLGHVKRVLGREGVCRKMPTKERWAVAKALRLYAYEYSIFGHGGRDSTGKAWLHAGQDKAQDAVVLAYLAVSP